ncbi:murein biosynthesis integral membrane protein MurJ [Candidatus Campbellbacteria bacterium]|nr:murein biosynthesis integral membrane protein MurJ [Candidatus Campbellbacteria bacterium]|tara:strand:+ start:3636 stop:5312 length:1677 start_codon:yes stop_codon:yes gene_type:complete
MERLTKLFNKEFSKISEAALILGLFTFLSQILGIFRDRYLAGDIGAGTTLDIYYAAFRVPDLIFTIGAALVSVSVLMPFLKTKLDESKEAGKSFLNSIFTVFFLFITLSSLIVFVLFPQISELVFPGFNKDELSQIVMLGRIMLLSPILLGISNLYATITQAYKQFFVYALAPVFYNIGIIVGIVALYPLFGVAGLAYGVVLGALLHMLIQIPVVVRHGLFPSIPKRIQFEQIKEVVKHSLPRTITLSMNKIVFLIFVSIASTLIPGTISIFNLSYNLQSVPLAIVGVSYSVAAFPVLVEYINQKNTEKFITHVMAPIRQIIFWSLPIVSLFIILRAQIVRVILGTGNFDWSDTRLTAAALALFIISVVAQSINLLLVRAYYAAGQTWKPLWITSLSSVITIISAYVLVTAYNSLPAMKEGFESLLRITDVTGSSVIMLALAYSIGMFINLIILVNVFRKDFPFTKSFGIRTTLRQSIIAAMVMGVVSYMALSVIAPHVDQNTTFGVLAHGFGAGLAGIVAGITALLLMGNEEMCSLRDTLKKRVISQPQIVETNIDT